MKEMYTTPWEYTTLTWSMDTIWSLCTIHQHYLTWFFFCCLFHWFYFSTFFMVHFGFGTYTVPSLPPTHTHIVTLTADPHHMTHSFHQELTATSFPKVDLTSRQSCTYVSSRRRPLTPALCRPPARFHLQIPIQNNLKKKKKKGKTFLNFLLWHTFLLPIWHRSAELSSQTRTYIHLQQTLFKKPKFMKIKVRGPFVLRGSAASGGRREVLSVLTPLRAQTQESGEPGYCSAL